MEENRNSVEKLINDPSFIRWVEGKSGREESQRWNRWIQKSEHNREKARQAQHRILGIAFKEPALPDIKTEWNKVYQDIQKEQQKDKAVSNKSKIIEHNRDIVSILMKAAAVLLVGAFVGVTAYLYQEPISEKQHIATQTVRTNYGQTKTINLSDGSQIILAPKSQLSYKENWLDKPVKKLTLQGEAYFAVAPQKAREHPKLVVQTEDGTASVWGTRFTVDTYAEGTRVVLEEGEVEVENRQEKKITMSPGEMAIFTKKATRIQLSQVNPKIYTSWFTDELFFNDTPLSVLFKRIERAYGVEVKVQDPRILEEKLSGSVDFKSLERLTNAVAEIFDIQIERSGETLIIDDNCKEK